MRRDLLEILACPDCREALEISEEGDADGGEVLEGALRCKGCGTTFPIEGGIPMLAPKE